MRYRTVRRPDDDVRRAIDDHLAGRKEESISYMVEAIRSRGIKFPTNHTAAMDEFKRLGYNLRHERNDWGALLRTYVQKGVV